MEAGFHFNGYCSRQVETCFHLLGRSPLLRYHGTVSTHSLAGERDLLRRDAELNRHEILEAARRLIAERGLGVSYVQIAREAGVGVGTVYRRFPNRDNLLHELYNDRVDAVVAIAEEALAVEDPWLGLCQFMERDFELQMTDRGLREFQLGRADSISLRRLAGFRITPLVTALVERARSAGQLRPEIGNGDIALIISMVGALMDASIDVAPDLWRRYLAMVLDGIQLGNRRNDLPGVSPERPEVEQILAGWVLAPRGQRRPQEPALSLDARTYPEGDPTP